MALTLSKHVGVRNHVIMACRLQRSRMRLAECATMPLHSLRFVDPPRRHTVIFTRCFSQCSPCLPRWVPWPCRSSKSPAIISSRTTVRPAHAVAQPPTTTIAPPMEPTCWPQTRQIAPHARHCARQTSTSQAIQESASRLSALLPPLTMSSATRVRVLGD